MGISLPLTKCRWFAKRKQNTTVGQWNIVIYAPDEPARLEHEQWSSDPSIRVFWRVVGGGTNYWIYTNSYPLEYEDWVALMEHLLVNIDGVIIPDPSDLLSLSRY